MPSCLIIVQPPINLFYSSVSSLVDTIIFCQLRDPSINYVDSPSRLWRDLASAISRNQIIGNYRIISRCHAIQGFYKLTRVICSFTMSWHGIKQQPVDAWGRFCKGDEIISFSKKYFYISSYYDCGYTVFLKTELIFSVNNCVNFFSEKYELPPRSLTVTVCRLSAFFIVSLL